MKIIYYIIILFTCYSCMSPSEKKNDNSVEKCPCDSIGVFTLKEEREVECYLGSSVIGIKSKSNDDTIEVTRYFTNDKKWHVQEYLIVANNSIVHPVFSMFCDIKDTGDFYKLSYIRNEEKFLQQGIITNKVLGVESIINEDTIKSSGLSVLVPKNKFEGVIRLVKIIDISVNGQQRITRATMHLDAKSMIKFGNLLNQYKAIKTLCPKVSS